MSAPLVFETLTLENFGGYYGRTSARFPSGERNIMLIQGRNTGGKTSFLNALKWCLYGEVDTRSANVLPLPQLFNTVAASEGQESMQVVLEARIKGEPYTIIRQAKRRFPNTRPMSDGDFTLCFVVKKDGQVLSEEQSRRIISRIAPKVIARFFLFDGELLKEYEDLIEKRKSTSTYPLVEAIEDVLGLPALKTASTILDRSLTQAQRTLSEKAKENSITQNTSILLDEANRKRDQALEDCRQTEERLDELERQKSALEKEVQKEREMDKLRGKIEQNESDRGRVASEIKELETALRDLSAMSWHDCMGLALTDTSEGIDQELERLNSTYRNHIIDEHQLKTLNQLMTSQHCEVCDQDVGRERLADIEGRINEMMRTEQDRRTQYEALQELNFRGKQIKELSRRMPPIYERYKATQERLYGQINDLSRLVDEYDRMEAEARNEDLDAVRERRERLDSTTQEIGFLKNSLKDSREKLGEQESLIDTYIDQISAAQTSGEIEVATQVKQKLEKLKKVFEAGREDLRERMRQHVEDYASRAYRAMIHESDHAGVRISQKNYELSIVDMSGNAITEPSAGATQVLALSLIVALGKAGRPIGPIVMDTPFGRLDEEHRGKVLRYLPRQASQLVLLYHSGELQPSTLNTVRSRVGCSYAIRKQQEGRSMLVEGDV